MITVQNVWVEIKTAGPAQRSCDCVDTDLGEGDILVNRCEDSGENTRKIQFANQPIGERHAKLSSTDALNFNNSW